MKAVTYTQFHKKINAYISSAIDIGSRADQEIHHIGAVPPSSHIQGRPSILQAVDEIPQ